MAVCPLSSYDVILGKKWLAKFDPLISHKTNKIIFQFENEQVTIQADLERHKSLVSASTFSRAIRRDYKNFALLLDPDQPSLPTTTPVSQVHELLDEFSDVFPDDLPKGLPPQRPHDFKIELQSDASPIKRVFTASKQRKLKNSRNNYMNCLKKGSLNQAQVHGAHPSSL
jgi:hypothetical protein